MGAAHVIARCAKIVPLNAHWIHHSRWLATGQTIVLHRSDVSIALKVQDAVHLQLVLDIGQDDAWSAYEKRPAYYAFW
jgi:hypothetical protein